MTWLRERTFQEVYGYEKLVQDEREARPSLTKEMFQWRRNRRIHIRKLANYKYKDHFDRKATYYYFGNPTTSSTLVMLDIDVQKTLKKGSTEGAVAFVKHLKNIWPDLYFEPSTGGKGIHAYLVLEKHGQDAQTVNAFLKTLQDWLRAEQEFTKADIELVEVKGTCPIIAMRDGKVESVKYGMFAKIPREAHRFEELAATTVLHIKDALPQSSGLVFKVIEPKKKTVSGSVSGKNISDDELALIPHFERHYEALGTVLRDQRYIVSSNDFAVFCVLQRFFFDNMNVDGTLPIRRVKKFWDALHECDQADRPFNHHRFKVIRDFLSQNRHIDWQDHRYQWSEGDKKGIACKWRVTNHFYELLEVVGKTGGHPLWSFMNSAKEQENTEHRLLIW